MYLFMTVPVYFNTVFLITSKIYPSTFLLFYMSTDVPVHHYNCAVYFFFFGITCTVTFSTHLPGHLHTDPPKIYVYLHPSLLSNHNDLPVTTTTCVPAHSCTCSWPYLFIFILSFRFIVKIYPSTFILFYIYTDVPVHHYTCSVYFFFFGITCTMTFQLIYWGIYKQIHIKINVPVYLHASLLSNRKDVPVTTTTCVQVHRCTRSGPYAFIFILSFRSTVKIYLSMVLLFYMSTYLPIHQYTCLVNFLFFCISYTMTFQLTYP